MPLSCNQIVYDLSKYFFKTEKINKSLKAFKTKTALN